MLYLYDVWVNWFANEEKGYNVCPDYEWRKNDDIDILEQVPCLHITDELYDHIENSLAEIPAALLNKIHEKTYFRIGQIREKLPYACIITNGRGVLLFDTVNSNKPLKKSRLISKQEQRVIHLTHKTKAYHFSIKQAIKQLKQDELLLDSLYMYGLTRKERQLKHLLINALFDLKKANNHIALWYWLSEWKGTTTISAERGNMEEIWRLLFGAVKQGWSKKHKHLCTQLIKGNPALQAFWEQEMKHSQNISK